MISKKRTSYAEGLQFAAAGLWFGSVKQIDGFLH